MSPQLDISSLMRHGEWWNRYEFLELVEGVDGVRADAFLFP